MKGIDGGQSQLDSLQLLQAYERAVDENIISSITDTKGSIIYANDKFCETSRYSASELIGQDHRIVNSGYHSKEFFRELWQTIVQGNVWHDEVRNRAKDGTFYWVDTVIVPVRDGHEKISHYLSLRTLITKRKELEAKDDQRHHALEALLVMTSQKVRKPLTECLKQMDLVEAGRLLSAAEQNEIMSNLKSSAQELDAFTKELTTFIRDMEV